MRKNLIIAAISLASTIGFGGMNINSAFGQSPQNLQNLGNNQTDLQNSQQNFSQNLQNSPINSQVNANLIAQSNEPKWVITGRQNIMRFVATMKENGVIQSHLGEKVLDPGQFARVVINFEPNSLDAKSEINAAIKQMISTMSEGERKLVIIAYKNGTITGLVITKFGRNMTTGITNIDVESLTQVFPGLESQIINFRGNPY